MLQLEKKLYKAKVEQFIMEHKITSCIPKAQVDCGAFNYNICTEIIKHCGNVVLIHTKLKELKIPVKEKNSGKR
jgi:hypothetical protein